MTIAFDIDGTWTLAPRLFRATAELFRTHGWTAIIVTGAVQSQDKMDRLRFPRAMPIVFCNGKLKEQAAREAGYKVDVWVDDMPGTIQETKILAGEVE